MLYIVGKVYISTNVIETFKKEIGVEGTFTFDTQDAAEKCAWSQARNRSGEWTVFEVKPLTVTKVVTVAADDAID